MTRRLILIATLVGLVAVVGVAAPTIEVDSASYAFDAVPPATVSHTFTLTNSGDELLIIDDVVPSCICTTAALSSGELAPGESAEVEVQIDTTGFVGMVLREVSIYSNDPAMPILTLVIDISTPEKATAMKISQADFLSVFYVLIDVRTPEEFEVGHLFGAVSIPLSELRENLDAWVPHLPKDVPLVVYCKRGVRSATAAQILFDAGFGNVYDLLGGIDVWIETYGESYLFDTLEAPIVEDSGNGG